MCDSFYYIPYTTVTIDRKKFKKKKGKKNENDSDMKDGIFRGRK
jgi:hypothetical protein